MNYNENYDMFTCKQNANVSIEGESFSLFPLFKENALFTCIGGTSDLKRWGGANGDMN